MSVNACGEWTLKDAPSLFQETTSEKSCSSASYSILWSLAGNLLDAGSDEDCFCEPVCLSVSACWGLDMIVGNKVAKSMQSSSCSFSGVFVYLVLVRLRDRFILCCELKNMNSLFSENISR